jgi:D-alanyl-D-alanine carboxypeptidase (penicillin-binding protein 5/6)
MDASTGQVIFAKNENEQRSPASLTKTMTLVVAFEAIRAGKAKLTDKAMTSPEAASFGGTQVYAEPGETFTLQEWLTAVAVGSANDASVVLAEHLGGTTQRFAQMMNEKARELGMTGTVFKNSHGLDEDGHYTTAKDMAILGRHASTIPELLKMTGTYQAPFRDSKFMLTNVNKQVRFYTGCDGLKTGHTDSAKYCVALTAKRGNSRFVSVVMGADTSDIRFADARKMLDYGFANYSTVPLAKKSEKLGEAPVYGGTEESLPFAPKEDLALLLGKGEEAGLEKKIEVVKDLKAPVKEGDVVANLVVSRAGKEIARRPLVAQKASAKAPFWRLLPRILREITSLRW